MDHDSGYKLLFKHPAMMRDLLKGFVDAEWLAEADFDSLTIVDRDYVTHRDKLQKRHGDVVWKIRVKNGRWAYVLIMLEFQSRNDKWMALRVMTYISLLYQDLVKQKQLDKDGMLPPVLPIVLHNGPRKWKSKRQVADLVATPPGTLQGFVPQCQYLLIDESSYDAERLNSMKNLAAALFRLETQREAADVVAVVQALVEWLKDDGNRELRRDFAAWIINFLEPTMPPEMHGQINDLQEVNSMFADNIKHAFAKCREEGELEGELKGVVETSARLLQKILRKTYATIPAAVTAKISAATPQQLEDWIDRVLDGQSMDTVFSGNLAS